MNRNGWIGSILFGAVSLVGVVALFSQARLPGVPARGERAGTRWTTLNPPGAEVDTLGDLVPATLKRGAHIEASGKTESEGKVQSGTTLRLR
jgi:hypothetical protein